MDLLERVSRVEWVDRLLVKLSDKSNELLRKFEAKGINIDEDRDLQTLKSYVDEFLSSRASWKNHIIAEADASGGEEMTYRLGVELFSTLTQYSWRDIPALNSVKDSIRNLLPDSWLNYERTEFIESATVAGDNLEVSSGGLGLWIFWDNNELEPGISYQDFRDLNDDLQAGVNETGEIPESWLLPLDFDWESYGLEAVNVEDPSWIRNAFDFFAGLIERNGTQVYEIPERFQNVEHVDREVVKGEETVTITAEEFEIIRNEEGAVEITRLNDAILNAFTSYYIPSSSCDEYVTHILNEADRKPSDWPDPKGVQVFNSDSTVRTYESHYRNSLRDNPSPGLNVVLLYNTDNKISAHMALYYMYSDGSLYATHFTDNKKNYGEYNSVNSINNGWSKYYTNQAIGITDGRIKFLSLGE